MKIEKNALTESASTMLSGLEEKHAAKPGASSEKRPEWDALTRSGALDGLQKAPVRVASSRSRSRTSGHASTAGADRTLQKQAGLYAEKKRVQWINATGVVSRVSHKIQAMLGMRDAQSRAQAFVEFMAEGKGKSDATALDLGDGWTRITRVVNGKTALIDVQCDSDGQVVDARHPGKFPFLPGGKEREAYNTVLHEMQLRAPDTLSQVPVYYVNRNTRGYLIPTHGYVVAGYPNRGRKSGAILYGVGGDPKRGHVVLDEKLLGHLIGKDYSKNPHKLSAEIRAALLALAGTLFATREEFYEAYRRARGGEASSFALHDEITAIYRLLPLSTMEMWQKKAGDYTVERPPAPERDLRAFEHLPRDFRRKVWLRKISDVDSIDLLEARQQFTLHQLYQDELLGRNGTGVPLRNPEVKMDVARRNRVLAPTPRFQRLPPHKTDKVGNCNTGASSLLQRAVDRYADKNNLPSKKVAAASCFGVGSTHRLAIWDPLGIDAKKGITS